MTLDFWACICSTALAAAVQPHLIDLEVPQTPNSKPSNPGPPKQTVEGLDEVLVLLNLQAHAAQINDWCCNMGAAFLDEVAEAAEILCDATALTPAARDRILEW